MKPVLWIPACCALALTLSNCGNSRNGGTQQAGTGPFDRNGRYVEAWADNPAKWRKPGNAPSPHELKSDEVPEIAKNEQPPQDANPLATSTPSKPVISQTEVATKSKPTVKETSSAAVKSKPTVKEGSAVVVKAKPKPKPKPVVKAKPKSSRYVVKSGDSLSAIASRTGSSVSAIKSANGISGTLIRPGQSLTIPKK